MSIRLIAGDCRDVLPTLAAGSVHCVVTSPPYLGLRDYGTATWDGGDAACDHEARANRADRPRNGLTGGLDTIEAATIYRDTCGKCGAVRIDRQIGLEATPDAYLATMVAVFREVKRVLRPDGTCFVNLGDSYCSATQCVRYELREHLSLRELQNVALAVFGVRITGDEAAGQGPMPEVLPVSDQGEAIRGRSTMEGQGVEEGVSTPSGGSYRANDRAEAEDQTRGDRCSRGQVRMLRGDDPAVFDTGPHSWRWGGASEKTDRTEPGLVGQDLPRGEAPRVSEGPLSGSLLQLQLRDRLMGLLSARQFGADEIPAAVRACFKASPALKPKDLLLMPARLALALQSDGWWVRSDIIWHKPNPMPESCTDRPTSAHEHVFLLTKSARYFYDSDAVREPHADWRDGHNTAAPQDQSGVRKWNPGRNEYNPAGRNLRNVWTIATSPFSDFHYATFPPTLAERCIRAGTSQAGCCAACGKPWGREVETDDPNGRLGKAYHDHTNELERGHRGVPAADGAPVKRTTGCQPGCKCYDVPPELSERYIEAPKVVPCTVLDPFAGAGTTLLVADRLQRDAIGIELNTAYTEMAMERCRADAPLFADMHPPPAEDPEDERMRDLFAELEATE